MSNEVISSPPPEYGKLKPLFMLQLAAPHTWPAAILPVLLAATLAIAEGYPLSLSLTFTLLLICILMQSAVNTFNDYYDFIKGTDSLDNQDDPTDAVLVYNNINPRSALMLGISFLLVAFALGGYVIYMAGWIPLAIGIIGALIIVLYSAGKTPLSYLPVGEYVSGITMGGLITLACYYALTSDFTLLTLLIALPIMLGIGLIMFTNNTCDIEKDIEAGRKTQAVLLGRKNARRAYQSVIVVWVLTIAILVGVFYTPGLIIIPFMLIILYPSLQMLFINPFTPQTRGLAMGACLNANISLGVFYCLCILVGSKVDITGIIV